MCRPFVGYIEAGQRTPVLSEGGCVCVCAFVCDEQFVNSFCVSIEDFNWKEIHFLLKDYIYELCGFHQIEKFEWILSVLYRETA
jgi:hypothetical protein